MSQISKLQVVKPQYWSGLTKQMNLGAIGMTKGPAQLGSMIDFLYEINEGDDNLVAMVNKFPTYYVDQEEYEWALRGPTERNIPLVKATYGTSETEVTSSTTALVGQNGVPFYLYFAEKWFTAPAVLAGYRPEDYQVKIVEDPVQIGSNWRYKVIIYGNDLNDYMPVEELVPGVPYGQLYTTTEQEMSKRGSDIQYSSYFKLRNRFSMSRKSSAVPGSMIKMGKNVPLAYQFVDNQGNKHTSWLNYFDWEFAKQCAREQAKLMLYGKSTIAASGESIIAGESGNPILAGYGLYEQMAGSNLGFYNTFNVDAFAKFLTDISYNKLKEGSRKFLVTTGQYGLEQFHKGMANKFNSGFTNSRTNSNYVMGSDGTVTIKEGQIMKYTYLNGIEISVMHDPMLDSPTTAGKIPHPNGGYVSSYIYNIWDIGTDQGESNIAKVMLKGEEEWFKYVPGMRDPFSVGGKGSNPGMAAHGGDTYELHKMYNASIRIKNPLKTARYMPNIYKSLGY